MSAASRRPHPRAHSRPRWPHQNTPTATDAVVHDHSFSSFLSFFSNFELLLLLQTLASVLHSIVHTTCGALGKVRGDDGRRPGCWPAAVPSICSPISADAACRHRRRRRQPLFGHLRAAAQHHSNSQDLVCVCHEAGGRRAGKREDGSGGG